MELVKELEIAHKNDVFRKLGFGITMTCGAAELPDVLGLMQRIRDFNEFDENNDPYHEHDLGRLKWHGDTVLWKIDYYNDKLTCFEDPLSPTCKRVMTVMLAEEY
jgi:hypothetical protein